MTLIARFPWLIIFTRANMCTGQAAESS